MSEFKSIKPNEFNENAFQLIGKEWLLIAAEKDGKVNAMTASWGGVGVIWAREVVYIFVRNSRFTKEFIDNSNTFSLTFFNKPEYAKMLGYMGKISGRNEDKIEKSGLTVTHHHDTPIFEQARIAITCRKLAYQPISPENFIDENLDSDFYADKDYHNLYIGEITDILVKG